MAQRKGSGPKLPPEPTANYNYFRQGPSSMAVVVNKPLPEFEANATSGVKVSNQTHLGHVVVLYFYPKDNTPGCTTEAMQFRDRSVASAPRRQTGSCYGR